MISRKDAKTQSSEFALSAFAALREALESKMNLWLIAFQQRSVWARGAKLGLSVGALQAFVNQGDKWLDHSTDSAVIAKSIISPLLTFSVAFVSAAATYVEKLKRHS